MTRLIDEVLAAPRSTGDVIGSYAPFAIELRRAEAFEFQADVVSACKQVAQSRPSSMVAALPLARIPYRATWIEWVPEGERHGYKPTPRRIGCLLQADDSTHQRGHATWAWSHPQGLSVPLLGMRFDWSQSADIGARLTAEMDAARAKFPAFRKFVDAVPPPPTTSPEEIKADMLGAPHLARFARDEREIAAEASMLRHMMPTAPPWAVTIALQLRGKIGEQNYTAVMQQWLNDLAGEPLFMLAALITLNSKNMIQNEREDLSRLNHARAKSGKHPLREVIQTRLSLSRRAGRIASGTTAATARRQHLVRGHFKVRKSGIYWWSPYVRGTGEAVLRAAYIVSR